MGMNFYEGLDMQVNDFGRSLGEECEKWMTEQISEFLNLPKTYKTSKVDKDGKVKEVSTPVDYTYAYSQLVSKGYYVTQKLTPTGKGAVLELEFYKTIKTVDCLIKSKYSVNVEDVPKEVKEEAKEVEETQEDK